MFSDLFHTLKVKEYKKFVLTKVATSKSTLLRKSNNNSNDLTIKNEFLKWINAGGRKIQGLVNRREKEVKVYFV
ncbi:glycoside hydrolase family protein [Chryseobacterium sp. CT-SW4]|uniref:glycoside hydrolase family protein n=1 Tax=Chryseobacterium sp. SW-1 TaxID=3157343 RepID=UPI003B01B89C